MGDALFEDDAIASQSSPGEPLNYDNMKAPELWKLCKKCAIKCSCGTKRDAQVAMLAHYDKAKAAYGDLLQALKGNEEALDSNNKLETHRTWNCMFRLLNVLFDDEFARHFVEIGNTVARAEFDSGNLNGSSLFCRDVAEAYQDVKHFDTLISERVEFEGVSPDTVIPHSTTKLHSMRKEVNNKFIQAVSKSSQSGTHDSDFWHFCRGDVLYLNEWLKVIKPGLTNFVNGMWLEGEGFTSFPGEEGTGSSKKSGSESTTPKRKKMLVESDDQDSMVQVVSSLQKFASSQQAAEKRKEQKEATKAEIGSFKVQHDQQHKMAKLKEVQEAISSIRKEMLDSDEEYKKELQEYLDFYVKQCTDLMASLK